MPLGDDAVAVYVTDWQPDGGVDLSDCVSLLQHLFLNGPAHHLSYTGGRERCVPIPGCKGSVGCRNP